MAGLRPELSRKERGGFTAPSLVRNVSSWADLGGSGVTPTVTACTHFGALVVTGAVVADWPAPGGLETVGFGVSPE